MNATTVVLYSDRNDPIALKALDEANPEIACIHVDQLIPLLSRRDWPKVLDIATTADIEAMFAGAKIINRAFTHLELSFHLACPPGASMSAGSMSACRIF